MQDNEWLQQDQWQYGKATLHWLIEILHYTPAQNANLVLHHSQVLMQQLLWYMYVLYTLLKSDVTHRDHVSVVMDAGSRIVNFIVNFIRDGTVFA